MTQKPQHLGLSSGQHRQALCAARAGFWCWHVSTNEFEIEDYSTSALASEPLEPISQRATLAALVHEEDVNQLIETIRHHSRENTPFEIEHRIRTSLNRWNWVSTRGKAMERDENGNPILVVAEYRESLGYKNPAVLETETDSLYRTILSNISDTVLITDSAGEFKFICPNIHTIFGFSEHEVQELGNVSRILGADLLDHRPTGNDTEAINIETVVKDKQGNSHTLLVNIKTVPIYGESFLFTCRDITVRKAAENALRESEDRFRTIIEAAPLGIVFTRNGQMLYENRSYLDMFGYQRPEELDGSSAIERVAPQNREEIKDRMHRRAAGEPVPNDYESMGLRKDGSQFPLAIWVTHMNFSDGPAVVTFHIDLTERKQAEEALRYSESMYRLIVNNAHEGIWRTDKELRTTYVNPKMAEMLGYSQTEMLEKNVYDFVDPEAEQRTQRLTQQRQNTGSVQGEVPFRSRDGSTLWGLVVSSNLYDENEQQLGVIAFITNVTERKKAEEALRDQARHIEAVNHELYEQLKENIKAKQSVAESEAALAALINNVDDSIFSIDKDKSLISFNSAFARRAKERLNLALYRGMPLAEYFPDTYLNEYLPLFDRVLAGESFVAPTHIYMPQREIEVYNEVNCNPIRDTSGEVTGAAIYVRDVTANRKAELALRVSEERFRRVVENIPLSFFLYDAKQNQFIYSNKIGEKTFTTLTGQPFGKHGVWKDHIYPEDLEALKPELNDKLILTNGSAEYRVVYPWGEIRYMRHLAFPILEKDNEILQIANFIEDITERKRTERALQQNQWLLANVLSNLPTGVAVYSLDGQILTVNARYARYFERTVETMFGRNVHETLPSEHLELWSQLTTIALRDNQIVQQEIRISMDDLPYTVLIECFPLFDTDNNVFASGQIIVDITDQKRVQDQLRDLSKQIIEVQEKERRHIARELHDEVGQSLTGVLLLLNKVERNASEDGINAVKQIQSITRQLMTQIRELSHNLHPPILDNHGLMSALHWYCNHYSSQTQIDIIFKYTGLMDRVSPEIELTCYRVIQEALTNIARYAKVEQANVEVFVSKTFVRLTVEDKGIGFDTETAQVKNETFGLSGMKERVALLQGQIAIISSPGQGTTVKVEIPLTEYFPFEREETELPDSQ